MHKIKSLFLIPFFLFWNIFAFAMEPVQDENISVNLEDINSYSAAIISGIGDALVNLADDIIHPVDNIILPMTDLIHDSAVIIAKHSPATDDMLILQNLIERNPQIYNASVLKMHERINEINKTANFIANASGPEKVRALVSMGTTIYVPGKVFTAARSVIKNVKAFGTPMPPRFHTKPFHTSSFSITPDPIEKLSLAQIRAIEGEEGLMYVVNRNRELIITERKHDHWYLGGGDPAYAAGELFIKDGKIIRVDNCSGSYEPSGPHLAHLVEEVFKREGFTEVSGKFVDWDAGFRAFLQKHPDNDHISPSRNQSAGITTRFDAPSPVGMIFGAYLLKSNKITDPTFQLANKLNLGFTCEALSWHEIEKINEEINYLATKEAAKKLKEETKPTEIPDSFFVKKSRMKFARLKKHAENSEKSSTKSIKIKTNKKTSSSHVTHTQPSPNSYVPVSEQVKDSFKHLEKQKKSDEQQRAYRAQQEKWQADCKKRQDDRDKLFQQQQADMKKRQEETEKHRNEQHKSYVNYIKVSSKVYGNSNTAGSGMFNNNNNSGLRIDIYTNGARATYNGRPAGQVYQSGANNISNCYNGRK